MKYFSLLRVQHYLKNLYIFLPIFFSGHFFDTGKFTGSLFAFISFCLAASGIYILNDLYDVPFDRQHPVKKLRPIASGKVNTAEAIVIMSGLLTGGLISSWFLSHELFAIILIYTVLNIGYTLKLKDIAIVDVAVIAIGFVLRVIAGGAVSDTVVSRWLIIMVFLLSMFQALAKRMDDIYLMDDVRDGYLRRSAAGYNVEFLQIALSMLTGVLIVCYIMYAVSPEITARLGENSYYTAFFVLLSMLRYLQLTFVKKITGSPVKVLVSDRFIQLNIVCWIAAFFVLIYLG